MLAQQWLYGKRDKCSLDKYLEYFLRLPDTHTSNLSPVVLNRLAERIVFTDDVPSLMYELCENQQMTMAGMLQSAHLPYDCFWLEYPTQVGITVGPSGDPLPAGNPITSGRYGALVQRINRHIDDNRVRVIIVSGAERSYGVCSGILFMVEFPYWPPKLTVHDNGDFSFEGETHYSYHQEQKHEKQISEEQMVNETGQIVLEIIFGIFLITQPRCYVASDVRYGERKQQHREKNDKPPLLEYRRIKMQIGQAVKRYARPSSVRINTWIDTESEAAVQHRRYHKVMGHFRHYTEKNPHTIWIAPHYRGDPKLGVVFTERDVVRAEAS